MRDPRKCIRIFFVRCLLKEAYSKSCGSNGTGETPQTRSVEEAHRLPRGKRAAWSGNQRTTLLAKTTFYPKRAKNKEPLKALLHFKAVLWHPVIPKLIHDKRCADKHRNDIIAETVEHENQKPQF